MSVGDGNDADTPPTRSYVDALLEGSLSQSELDKLRSEIASGDIHGEDDEHGQRTRAHSYSPEERASSRPEADDDDDARTLMRHPGHAFVAPPPPRAPLESAPLIDLDMPPSIPAPYPPPSSNPPISSRPFVDLDMPMSIPAPFAPPISSRPMVDLDMPLSIPAPRSAPPSSNPPISSRPLVDLDMPLSTPAPPPSSRPPVTRPSGKPPIARSAHSAPPPARSPLSAPPLARPSHSAPPPAGRSSYSAPPPTARSSHSAPPPNRPLLGVEVPLSVPPPASQDGRAIEATYLDAVGGTASVPRLAVAPAQLAGLPLGYQAGLVASFIDGMSSVDDLLDISGLGRLETLRILYDLLQQGVIAVGRR